MTQSILSTVKESLSILPSDTAFDAEIKIHINSVLADLHQLGVGPEEGFVITDADETWADLLGELSLNRLNNVQSYIYLRVRLLFDPPTTAHALSSFQKQVEQFEWRITVAVSELQPPVAAEVVEP